MPTLVHCPHCGVALRLRGKLTPALKCPKCQGSLGDPPEEVDVVEESRPVSRRLKPRRKARSSSASTGVVIGSLVAGVLVVGSLIIAICMFTFSSEKPAPTPVVNQDQFDDPEAGFKINFKVGSAAPPRAAFDRLDTETALGKTRYRLRPPRSVTVENNAIDTQHEGKHYKGESVVYTRSAPGKLSLAISVVRVPDEELATPVQQQAETFLKDADQALREQKSAGLTPVGAQLITLIQGIHFARQQVELTSADGVREHGFIYAGLDGQTGFRVLMLAAEPNHQAALDEAEAAIHTLRK